MLEAFLQAGLIVLAAMTLLWLLSLAVKDSSIVDIFWGTGFVLLVWFYYWSTPQGDPARKLLIVGLVMLWGLRLSLYVAWRNLGKGEDYRYRRWRMEAGRAWWWRSYFKVFLLQGLIMWVISAPLLAAQQATGSQGLNALDLLGAFIWLVGFIFESVGDYQLARFKSDPANKGEVLTSGLWRYSRHPNYFGDAAQWWGFFLIAAAAGGWITIFSPIIMSYLLVRVSGKAMLERDMVRKKPEYRDYIEGTSGFVPWFPEGSGSN